MLSRKYQFIDEEGFHVRPATQLSRLAKKFVSEISIIFEGERFNGKSPLEIMGACIEDKMVFTVEIVGDDEVEADCAIRNLMVHGQEPFFSEVIENSTDITHDGKIVTEKQIECEMPPGAYRGLSVSTGIGIGPAAIFRSFDINKEINQYDGTTINSQEEERRLLLAIDEVYRDIQNEIDKANETTDAVQIQLLTAHLQILEDASFQDRLLENVRVSNRNAAYATLKSAQMYESEFLQLNNERMRQRLGDLQDLCIRIFRKLTGKHEAFIVTEPNSMIIADDLLPSQTMRLHPDDVSGFILEHGGPNSHTAILARSMGIPALVGVKNVCEIIMDGEIVALNGIDGYFLINPDDNIRKAFQIRQHENRMHRMNMQDQYRQAKTKTIDGKTIRLLANVQSIDGLNAVIDNGAEGIGLFRTEYLYMNRKTPPLVHEQFEIYKTVIDQMKGLPITFRTLDAGGDKPIESLTLASEMNSFLGIRGIRYSLSNPDLFRDQIRALLLASAFGDIKIMFPMVSILEELIQAKKIVEEIKEELISQNRHVGHYQIGIMIETPSSALICDIFARYVDFMSVGSNDLIQYTMAADRGNALLSDLASPYHPAVLKLISMVATAADRTKISWSVCGESASDPLLAVFYMSLGVADLSISPTAVPGQRNLVNHLNIKEAKLLHDDLSLCETAEQAKKKLQDFLSKCSETD